MHIFKFQWKHWLLLCTALLMTATLVAGCAAEEAEEEKPTIKFVDTQFESLWICNAIAKFIIEEGYGYPVETVPVAVPVYEVVLPKGELHVMMELWQHYHVDWYNEEIAKGTIENAGMVYEGAPSFFMIPTWVHEEYNIKTVEDMKEHWELFKDPEDPTKGYFISCPIGWQCQVINSVKMEAYGLTEYYNIIESTAGAMEAALAGPQKKHKPVFGYYWEPTALMGMYDWYLLEEPEYDEAIWAQIIAAIDDESLRPLKEACAYETVPIDKGIWVGLRDMAPDVVAMLEKMVVGLESLNATAAWAVENEVQDWEEAAIWYLKTYEERWKTWVTDDAYNKIKAALAEL